MGNNDREELELLIDARKNSGWCLDVSMREFETIVGQGGRIHGINEKTVDNCYIHRANYCGELFKTVTTEPREI